MKQENWWWRLVNESFNGFLVRTRHLGNRIYKWLTENMPNPRMCEDIRIPKRILQHSFSNLISLLSIHPPSHCFSFEKKKQKRKKTKKKKTINKTKNHCQTFIFIVAKKVGSYLVWIWNSLYCFPEGIDWRKLTMITSSSEKQQKRDPFSLTASRYEIIYHKVKLVIKLSQSYQSLNTSKESVVVRFSWNLSN